MSTRARQPLIRVGAVVAIAITAAGCGGQSAAVASSSPSPLVTPSATPSPSPSPSPRPSPSPAASPSPSIGIVGDLAIGSPYELVENPSNTTLSGHVNFELGSVKVEEVITGREIHQRTKLVGMLLVLEFSGFPMSDAAFEGGARGAAATSGGTLKYGEILGHRVAIVTATGGAFGMYVHGEAIIMVAADSSSLMRTLLTAVIKAND